ncbi:MAG: YjjG family noncanonical pyrimidine nucleotidase [Bacteroidales bacterium]|jgi:putative hydrolase of the HAD superfamily
MIVDNYKYFLFDLDRTVWDFDKISEASMYSVLGKNNLLIEDKKDFFKKYEVINNQLWHQYEEGIITKETLRVQRFYQTFKTHYGIDDIRFSEQFGSDYLNQIGYGKTLMPGALNVLQLLSERRCKMAIVSNGFKEVQYRKLKSSGVEQYFNSIIISDEVGVNKPNPKIFEIAMQSLGGNKRETLMVGDDFINDIEGAQIYGIDQFYYNFYNRQCNGHPTYESDDMLALIK